MKIGDKVTIKDSDQQYTTYYDMFEKLGFKNPNSMKNLRNSYPDGCKGVVFTIFNIGKHEELFAIRDIKGNEFLLNKKGLKIYKDFDFNVDPMTGIIYPKEVKTVENKIKKIVSEQLGCKLHEVELTSSLRNDLGADELDIVELVMEIEREFEEYITDEEAETIKTVKDLLDLITPEPKIATKKTVKKRVIKFVETTYDDGTVVVKPHTKEFNDFELIGLLGYYYDLFKNQINIE